MCLEVILPFVLELLVDPINQYVVMPIRKTISYAFKSERRVQTLQDDVVQLKNKKERLQQSVDEAARNGEEIYLNVTEWLSTADKAVAEAEILVQRKEEARNKCFAGLCPNLKSRYRLSKNAEEKAADIQKLQNEGGLDPISFRPPVQQIVEKSVYSRETLPSRVSMLNQIMGALRDPNLNMIGVYGMGGVGKTTLAKEVQEKAAQEKLFEPVVLVAVNQTQELRRIQGEIAGFLGLKLDMEEIPVRASLLHRRLEDARVLIILDDLWQKLDLDAVGIPSGGTLRACKIMLTSRNTDLLSKEMGAQELFSLEALREVEALRLFKSIAQPADPNLDAIATEIATKCAGLPLLIHIIATQVKNKESHVWNTALNLLSTFEDETMYEKVYKVLESSYRHLPTKEMKSFFLLCAFYGQPRIPIQYLLTYSMSMDSFKHIRTIEGARDKVLTLIDVLKANSLLLDGDMAGFVRIHDVVRDTALNIASKEQHAFIGTGEVTLRDWPNEDCSGIFLPYCDVRELPPRMNCPEAELFLLFTGDLSLKIPDLFFIGNRKLRGVDFTGMRIECLPSSMGSLASLKTLCLHSCWLGNASVLGELNQLELLSFAGSKIVELPREIEAMTRLKVLDLSGCSSLQVIRAGVLSNLCSLEELYLLNSFNWWGSEGNATLSELDSLSHLSTLHIEIKDPKIIPKGFKCFSQLRRYQIFIGHRWGWNSHNERSRTLKLSAETDFRMEDGIEMLVREAEDLYLDGVRGIESILLEGCPNMKHMHIENDLDIQHLIKSTSNAFPSLESLYLINLQGLQKVFSSQLGGWSFGVLQIFKISKCDKLTSLFSFSSVKCFQQLRELQVESCENMEAVVGEGFEDADHHNEVIEFTQLRSLKLENLPRLRGFCRLKEESQQTGLLFDAMVSFPNLTSLEVETCGSLEYIFTTSMVKCLTQLKYLEIGLCWSVREIMQNKNVGGAEEHILETILFPELEFLSLRTLGNMKRFSSCCSIEFPLLRNLSFLNCNSMVNFVGRNSSSESTEAYLFNEMATLSNLESLDIWGMDSIIYLWDDQFVADGSFSKLKSVRVSYCSMLSVVFPSNICTRFQRLEQLSLSDCYRLEMIYQGIDFSEIKGVFSLRELKIQSMTYLKQIWNQESQWDGAFSTFQNLQSVEVSSCFHLNHVFPESVACGLLQLQRLRLHGCYELKAVIAMEKHDETSHVFFQFPELKELQLKRLRKMRNFYEGGPHTFYCPKLIFVELEQCSRFFVEKQNFQKLEQMTIDEASFLAIHNDIPEFSVELYTKLKKVTLMEFKETAVAVGLEFVSGIKSLEMLVLNNCSLEDTLIGEEQHPRLKVQHLELLGVRSLKHITKKGFKLLQHLQTLKMEACRDLISVAPSSVCLQNLMSLHVQSCHDVKNLVTASTAKTMVQLTEMKVVKCSKIEEIVGKDGDGKEDDVIIFKKLKFLELTSLHINSFCSSKHSFSFPLLEQVTIKYCPRMNIFCCGDVSAPQLRGIMFEDEKQWEGNLNDTMSSRIRDWVGENLEEGLRFKNMERLELVSNTTLSKAILSASQMQSLRNLRTIRVRNCDSIQVAFDLEGDIGLLPPKLNELELTNLPMLTQLCNKSPKGILDFSRLRELKIEKCSRLVYAFTWSMASSLYQLRSIEVKNCETMETLIKGEHNDAATEAIFNKLENVVFENMPKLSSVYSGNGDLEFPSLEAVTTRECPSFKSFFVSTHVHSADSVFPRWKKFSTDMVSFKTMMQFEAPETFQSLEILEVGLRFQFSEEIESAELDECNGLMNLMTPSMARNMVRLKILSVLNCKMLTEIVGDERDHATYEINFPNLERLELIGLQSLKAFSSTHYNFDFHCLRYVNVLQCPDMGIFCHGTVNAPTLNCVRQDDIDRICPHHWKGDLNATIAYMYQEKLLL